MFLDLREARLGHLSADLLGQESELLWGAHRGVRSKVDDRHASSRLQRLLEATEVVSAVRQVVISVHNQDHIHLGLEVRRIRRRLYGDDVGQRFLLRAIAKVRDHRRPDPMTCTFG